MNTKKRIIITTSSMAMIAVIAAVLIVTENKLPESSAPPIVSASESLSPEKPTPPPLPFLEFTHQQPNTWEFITMSVNGDEFEIERDIAHVKIGGEAVETVAGEVPDLATEARFTLKIVDVVDGCVADGYDIEAFFLYWNQYWVLISKDDQLFVTPVDSDAFEGVMSFTDFYDKIWEFHYNAGDEKIYGGFGI